MERNRKIGIEVQAGKKAEILVGKLYNILTDGSGSIAAKVRDDYICEVSIDAPKEEAEKCLKTCNDTGIPMRLTYVK